MAEEPFATRRELDMLIARVDSIDRDGTRGVMALHQQLTDAIKDVAELKVELNNFKKDTSTWYNRHNEQHEQDLKSRADSRRWMVGTALAGILSMVAVITLLVQVLQSVHH